MRGNICFKLALHFSFDLELSNRIPVESSTGLYEVDVFYWFYNKGLSLTILLLFLKKSDSRGTGEPLGKSKFVHVLFLLEEFLKIEQLFILIVQQYMVIQLQSKPVRTIADRFC